MELPDIKDTLMWEMLRLAWANVDRSKATYYTMQNLGTVQGELLEAIKSGQYTTIDIDGCLQAFATWNIDDGVVEVTNAAANKGFMSSLLRKIRTQVKCKGARWHRPKGWRDFPRQRGIV